MFSLDSKAKFVTFVKANQKMVSAFSGELTVSDTVQVGGFRAGGLAIKVG
jgi:hypothetical protein